MMAKKVEAEGEKEKEAYDKFMCWCKSSLGGLEKAVADANIAIPDTQKTIEELEAKLVQLKAEDDKLKQDRTEAKTAIKVATEIREKEAKAFEAAKVDNSVYISALE